MYVCMYACSINHWSSLTLKLQAQRQWVERRTSAKGDEEAALERRLRSIGSLAVSRGIASFGSEGGVCAPYVCM